MRSRLTALILVLASVACTSQTQLPSAQRSPQGPPEIQFDLVARHGAQFDEDVPDRRPGSQQELAAASYILGHLQLAGYTPYLDGVPVADQVRSTNVVALPPSGAEPRSVVAIAYDTGARHDDRGRYLGLFLEMARAIQVAEPRHAVAFVAVGAESSDHRGSRRLAQYLLDEGWDPIIYSINLAIPEDEDALKAAGFDHRFIYGQVGYVASELMPVLLETRS